METDMNTLIRSPWFAVVLGIAGLITGYMTMVAHTGVAYSAKLECPAKHACKGDNCTKAVKCTNGKCGEGCTGSCGEKHA